jgi:competence ComEA-like helix-hairpin-helix protein
MMMRRLPKAFPRLAAASSCAVALLLTQASCVKQTRRAPLVRGQNATRVAAPTVNLNTATREELKRLPGIGDALASRIVEHRERYGRFRRPEQLLIVRGISERRFRELGSLITAE